MTKPIEDKLAKIPVINSLVVFFKKIKLPGFEGLSTYDLLEMYIVGIIQGALTSRASAIAFSFFSTIFPFLLFTIILIPVLPFENFQTQFITFLDSFLPPQTSEFFNENIFKNINKDRHAGLLSSVFVLSIILMANGVNTVFSGFERSYHQQLRRNFFRQWAYSLGIARILALLLIITIGGFGYFQIYVITPIYEGISGKFIEESDSGLAWILFSKYAFFIFMIYVASATLYYFGTKEGKDSKFFSAGALFTTLFVILTSYLFGIYIENFGQYNKLYGSIGALLILLLYLWLNANILLLGYELNASLNKLRKIG